MTTSDSKTAELRVKNLEMIQGVVTRMASNGASSKNYCVTVTTAVCGFGLTLERPVLLLLAFFPLIGFALIHTQYLKLERQFRTLFERVRTEDWETTPTFELSTNGIASHSFANVLLSWSILSFYLPLMAAILFIVIITRLQYGA